jgi:hypothetical protein
MSSVGRGFAARLTNNFVANGNISVVPDAFEGGAWLLSFSSIIPVLAFFNPTYDQPFANLKYKFISFGSVGDLVGGLTALWNNLSVTATPYETLIDMGREIQFGVRGGANDLVTFRVVQRTNGTGATNGVGGANDNGYNTFLVPISNKLSGSQLQGIFPVQVSRQ